MSQAEAGSAQTYADLKHKIDPPQIRVADPDTEDTEIVVKAPWDLADYPGSRLQWGEQHDVCATFLPFAYLSYDPVEIIGNIGEFLNQVPATKQRVPVSKLYSEGDIEGGGTTTLSFKDVCLLFGWWRGGVGAASGPYYCNPEYVHDHPDDDCISEWTYWDDDANEYVNERFDLAIRAARLGLAGPVLTPAFGMDSRNGPRWWLSKHGFDWESKFKDGRRTMARTFKTINKWGYLYDEIGSAFDIPTTTLTDRVRRHASEFEPPADPSYHVVPAGGDGDE